MVKLHGVYHLDINFKKFGSVCAFDISIEVDVCLSDICVLVGVNVCLLISFDPL